MDTILLTITLTTFVIFIGLTITESSLSELQNFVREKFNYTGLNRTLNVTRRRDNNKTWLFKDYLMKFNPNVVFDKIVKKKKTIGKNASVAQDFDEIFNGIDMTDDLLRLNIESISGRRKAWRPPGDINTEAMGKDAFSLRMRIYELIRHTIYQTRNKLVIMQVLRNKYRNSTLYKMGFLMSKTDTACKNFHAFAFRSIHPCYARYYVMAQRYEIISMMHAEERLNNKWFEIELLIDLIETNHLNAKAVLRKYISDRKQKWKFED